MMKCFYIGDNHWFDTCDRGHQELFEKEAYPYNKVELKPIQQMIKDLKKAQQAKNDYEGASSNVVHESTPEPTPKAPQVEPQVEQVEAEVQPAESKLKDLMAQLEKHKKMQAKLEQQIAMQNEKAIMQDLKPKYEEVVSKINKKRSFQNLTFDFGNLPPTKRAKSFKDDINHFIKDAQTQEKLALIAGNK